MSEAEQNDKHFLETLFGKLPEPPSKEEEKENQRQIKEFDERIAVAEASIAKSNIEKIKIMIEAYELVGSTFTADKYAESLGRELTSNEKSYISSLKEK